MNDTKKLVLIPESQYISSDNSRIFNPPAKNEAIRLHSAMDETLNYQDPDPYKQLKHYQELLHRYMNVLQQTQTRGLESTNTTTSSLQSDLPRDDDSRPRSEILETIPTRLRQNADRILNTLEKDPSIIRWNARGNIYYKGKLIAGSNIVDLLSNAVNYRKSMFIPHGQDAFIHSLYDLNIPESIIANSGMRTLYSQLKMGVQTPQIVNETSTSTRSVKRDTRDSRSETRRINSNSKRAVAVRKRSLDKVSSKSWLPYSYH